MSCVFGYRGQTYTIDPESDASTIGKITQLQETAGGRQLTFIDPAQVGSGQEETLPGTYTFQGTGAQTGEFGGLTIETARVITQDSHLPSAGKGSIVHLLIKGGPSTVNLATANNHLETTTPLPSAFRPEETVIVGTAQLVDSGSNRRELVMSINPNGIIELQPNDAVTAGAATLTSSSVSYFVPSA